MAEALDRPLNWFLAPQTPDQVEAQHVSDLFLDASADLRAQVLRLLDPDPTGPDRAQRVCLIGLRGAGKSTLGKLAGEALGIPFVELNDEIEDQSGMPVDEVMALYGNEGYRKLEAQALERVISGHARMILAVAGGIVAEPETYATLLRHFHTVWVKTSPGEHMARVRAQGDERPMAGNPEAMAQLRSILTAREALYDRAQTSLDTSGQPVDQSLGELLGLIREYRFLD